MAAVRRPAAAAVAAAVAASGINFFDDGFYSGMQFIPDGDYACFFNVIMHQGKDTTRRARLGVMVDFYSLENPTEEAKLQSFYSMGSKADESFAPNPETGKGIVAIPGAKGQSLNDSTNWNVFRKSLMDSGLPPGTVTNDLGTIDGIWLHVENQDEPAERGNFQSATAEVQEVRRKNKIAVATEILENGKPWEGTGGLPAAPVAQAAAPAKPAVAPRAAAPRPAAARPAPVPVALPAADEGVDVRDQASTVLTDVLMKKPLGMKLLALNSDAFGAAKKKFGDEVANQIAETVLQDAEVMATLLGDLGMQIVGSDVKPLPA